MDNGGGFVNKNLNGLCDVNGILKPIKVPYTP
jgi:hypothetical protein